MDVKEMRIENLIDQYQKKNAIKVLKCIIQKVITENLTYEEYIKLFEIPCNSLQKIIILKAPANVLAEIIYITEDEELINEIISRLEELNSGDKLDFDKMIEAKSNTLREFSISYVSYEKLVEHLLKEDDEEIINNIFDILEQKNYKLSVKEADSLMDCKNLNIVLFASKYASQDKFIETVINNREFSQVRSILHNLEKFEFTEEQADLVLNALNYSNNLSEEIVEYIIKYVSLDKLVEVLLSKNYLSYLYNFSLIIKDRFNNLKDIQKYADILIDSTSWDVRAYFAHYVSKEKLKEALKQEKNDLVICNIVQKLYSYNITTKEADELIDFLPFESKVFLLRYISTKKILEILLLDDNDFSDVVMDRVNFSELTQDEVNTLVDSKSYEVRKVAIKYSSSKKLIERLRVEENEEVIKDIIDKLEKLKYVPSEEELESFTVSIDKCCYKIMLYVCKYLSKEKVIELAKTVVVDFGFLISTRLEKEVLTKKDANELINSNSIPIRRCAIKYASEDALIKRLEVEDFIVLISDIAERLQNYKFSEQEANKLIESEYYKLRILGVDYASKDKILNMLLFEEHIVVVEKCIKKFDECGISKQDANKLLNAYRPLVREYASKYASKDKILKHLVVETNTECISKMIQNFSN